MKIEKKWSPEIFEEIIKQIKAEAHAYPIPPSLMKKVSDGSKYGNASIQNLNGLHGYNYQTLALLIKYLKPRNILELGSQLGLSAAMMYYEMEKDARMVTVDILKDQRFVPEEIWKDDRARFVIGDVLDLNIYGDDIPVNVDFLFTDTEHFYKQLSNEFFIYEHLLANEAIILIDDIHLNDKGKFFDELQFSKWEIDLLAHPSGLGIVLYERRGREVNLSVDERKTMAALASARFWRDEASSIANRRIRINMPAIKQDIKKELKRYPRIEKGIINHVAPAVRRTIRKIRKVFK